MGAKKFNVFRSYERYTKVFFQTNGFYIQLKGVFFLFSGRLDKPSYAASFTQVLFSRNNRVRGHNHYGLYDYLTLAIPRSLEYFARGNWLPTKNTQKWCKLIFLIIPIWPLLTTARYTFGFICTLLASPFIYAIDAYERNEDSMSIDNCYAILGCAAERVEQNLAHKNDIFKSSFDKNYTDFKKLYKEYHGNVNKALESQLLLQHEKVLRKLSKCSANTKDDATLRRIKEKLESGKYAKESVRNASEPSDSNHAAPGLF